jgi:predicted nucleotidyltransferase
MLVGKVVNKAFFAEQNSIREIARIFKKQLGEKFQEAVIFGSVAKKKERPDSDFDILVVVRNSTNLDSIEDQVNEAANLATAASGNPVMPIVIQAGEYEKKKMAKSKQGIWKEIFDRNKSITYTKEDIEAYGAEDQ